MASITTPHVSDQAAVNITRYAKQVPWVTQLSPQDEKEFQQWVKQNRIPFDPSPQSDYDMRGHWKAMQTGDNRATPLGPGADALQWSLSQHPGMTKVFNKNNTAVVFADSKRAAAAPGSLEYWPPGEEGDKNLPRPQGYDNKHIIEVYDHALQKDPIKLREAIHGDLLHGMVNDPEFSEMRQQFISSYPPDVKNFNDKWRKTHRDVSPNALDDMYIRGRLAKNQGVEWENPSRYSQKQLEVLDRMRSYLGSGATQGSTTQPDTWKTPYNPTFSNESMYATPNAPRWQQTGKTRRLINEFGNVLKEEQ